MSFFLKLVRIFGFSKDSADGTACCAVINTMVLQNLQDCASYFRLQNYASHRGWRKDVFHYKTIFHQSPKV
jgi:hypothetical protein